MIAAMGLLTFSMANYKQRYIFLSIIPPLLHPT